MPPHPAEAWLSQCMTNPVGARLYQSPTGASDPQEMRLWEMKLWEMKLWKMKLWEIRLWEINLWKIKLSKMKL